ncbi:hypothetical protein PAPHI01_1177 [Pancytospora philotis]|nr:hypothetical protein PAPHI01_1177 [Pancytospora philotis]
MASTKTYAIGVVSVLALGIIGAGCYWSYNHFKADAPAAPATSTDAAPADTSAASSASPTAASKRELDVVPSCSYEAPSQQPVTEHLQEMPFREGPHRGSTSSEMPKTESTQFSPLEDGWVHPLRSSPREPVDWEAPRHNVSRIHQMHYGDLQDQGEMSHRDWPQLSQDELVRREAQSGRADWKRAKNEERKRDRELVEQNFPRRQPQVLPVRPSVLSEHELDENARKQLERERKDNTTGGIQTEINPRLQECDQALKEQQRLNKEEWDKQNRYQKTALERLDINYNDHLEHFRDRLSGHKLEEAIQRRKEKYDEDLKALKEEHEYNQQEMKKEHDAALIKVSKLYFPNY